MAAKGTYLHDQAGAPLPGWDRALLRVTQAGIWAGLLAPAVVIPGVYQHYTFSKMVFFQVVVGLSVPAYVILALRHPRFRPGGSPVGAGALAWMLVLGVLVATAQDPGRAWWSQPARMTGCFSMLHILAWAVMATGCAPWRWLLTGAGGLAVVLTAVPLLQTMKPTFLMWGMTPESRVVGLQGNAIYLGTCLTLGFFFTAGLSTLSTTPRGAMAWRALMAAQFLALLASGSRGPLMGWAAGVMVALLAAAADKGNLKLVCAVSGTAILMGVAYLGLAWGWVHLDVVDTHPALRHLVTWGDAARVGYWSITWDAIQAKPWLGWGWENVDVAYVASYRAVNACTPFFEDRPHNQVLEVLATGGLLGGLAWLALWSLVVRSTWRLRCSHHAGQRLWAPLLGMWTAHLVGGLVAFDSPSSWILLALAWVVLHQLTRTHVLTVSPQKPKHTFGLTHAAAWLSLTAAGALVVAQFSVIPFHGSAVEIDANTAHARGQHSAMVALHRQAAPLMYPYGEEWVLAVSMHVAQLASQGKLKSVPKWEDLLNLAGRVAQPVLDHAGPRARIGPAYARMLFNVGQASQQARFAQEAWRQLQVNLALNPRRPNTLMDHADALWAQGKLDGAQEEYDRALALGPDNALVNWRAGYFLWQRNGHRDEAAARLVASTSCPCGAALQPLQVALLAQAYAHQGERTLLARLGVNAQGFARTHAAPALTVARTLEDQGLMAERNGVLLALPRGTGPAGGYHAVVEGKQTLAELEQGGGCANGGVPNAEECVH